MSNKQNTGNKLLAKLVEEYLSNNKLSERQLAKKLGLSATTIGRIRRGESVDVETLVTVCRELNISPSYILNGQLPGDKSLGVSLAAVVEREPRLAKVFGIALDKLLSGEIDSSALRDVVNYMVFRLGITDQGKQNGASTNTSVSADESGGS